MLLLDTHVWLWSAHGDARRVGPRTRRLLSKAETRAEIRISPASLFELSALHTGGRIQLALTPEQWMREALTAPGIRVAPLTPGIAVAAGYIPRAALADPLDRLLVATARDLDALFLTSDAAILDYARTAGGLRVHKASD